MDPVGPSPRQLQQQEVSPDAAGLEPSVEGMAGVLTALMASPPPPTGKEKHIRARRKSWVDQPVSIRIILALSLPSVAEQLISAAVGLTDTIVAGHIGDSEEHRAAAAAAVGTMSYLQWFAGLMTAALGVGATAIVARYIGAKKARAANLIAGTVCTAAFIVGLLVALVFHFAAWPLVSLFGLKDEAALFAVQYLQIMSFTICFQSAGQIGMACLRGAGDTLRPMLVTIAIALVNCVACPTLSFGWFGFPAMGIRGNAIGTLLAFTAAGVVTFFFLFFGDAGLRLRPGHLRIVVRPLIRVARIGVPSWIEGMLLWGGQALIVIFIMRQVDEAIGLSGVTIAAHGATLRIESLAFLPGFGFGIACAALVGQYLGAGKPDEAQRTSNLSNRLAVVTMSIAAIPMVSAGWPLLRLLVDSRPVVSLALVPLILAGLVQPIFAVAIIRSSTLKGAGDTVSPMLTALLGMGGRVGALLAVMPVLQRIGQSELGLIAVWACIFLDLSLRALVMETVFRRGKWKDIRV